LFSLFVVLRKSVTPKIILPFLHDSFIFVTTQEQ